MIGPNGEVSHHCPSTGCGIPPSSTERKDDCRATFYGCQYGHSWVTYDEGDWVLLSGEKK